MDTKEQAKTITGRVFSASLKPAWTDGQIREFLKSMKGTAIVFAINHDKDSDDETGEAVEPHTHLLIEYDNPRKLTTVSNLLKVDDNFIELVRNKKAFLRYLTHLDDPDKYQYSADEVQTNYGITYEECAMGATLTDRDIARVLAEGRGLDLLGIVPSTKLRTIQAFLQYDRTGQMQEQLSGMRDQLQYVVGIMKQVDEIATSFNKSIAYTADQLKAGMLSISNAVNRATQRLASK